jgi:hypothetical protein
MSPDYITPYFSRLSNLAKLHHSVYCEDVNFRGVIGWRFKNSMPVTVNLKQFARFFNYIERSAALRFHPSF